MFFIFGFEVVDFGIVDLGVVFLVISCYVFKYGLVDGEYFLIMR